MKILLAQEPLEEAEEFFDITEINNEIWELVAKDRTIEVFRKEGYNKENDTEVQEIMFQNHMDNLIWIVQTSNSYNGGDWPKKWNTVIKRTYMNIYTNSKNIVD
jgi:hypothetical protein